MNNYRSLSRRLAKILAVAAVSSLALGSAVNAQQVFPNQPPVALPGAPVAIPAAPVALPADVTAGEISKNVRDMSAGASDLLKSFQDGTPDEVEALDVDELAALDREVQRLGKLKEKVTLYAEIYKVLNPKKEEEDEKVSALENEVERLESELAAAEAAPILIEQKDPPPVVAEIQGAAGQMEAKILVPYMGEVMARPGTVLPNGMKVVSISASGVRAKDGDSTISLAFGTSVPSARPVVSSVQR